MFRSGDVLIWLVVWNMTYFFPFSWEFHQIPIDEVTFFRGVVEITNQLLENPIQPSFSLGFPMVFFMFYQWFHGFQACCMPVIFVTVEEVFDPTSDLGDNGSTWVRPGDVEVGPGKWSIVPDVSFLLLFFLDSG